MIGKATYVTSIAHIEIYPSWSSSAAALRERRSTDLDGSRRLEVFVALQDCGYLLKEANV